MFPEQESGFRAFAASPQEEGRGKPEHPLLPLPLLPSKIYPYETRASFIGFKWDSIMKTKLTDLTQRPPRSPRVRLGGHVILPRMLDKGRALLAGKNGEYNYACPQDQQFLQFTGINPDELKQQLAEGKGDLEILEWIKAHGKKHSADEIASWSAKQEKRVPEDAGSREFYNQTLQKIGPKRKDVTTWFDLLDLDDYVSFGGTG